MCSLCVCLVHTVVKFLLFNHFRIELIEKYDLSHLAAISLSVICEFKSILFDPLSPADFFSKYCAKIEA